MSKISLVRDATTNELFSAVIFDDTRVSGVPIAAKSLPWADWVNQSSATFTDVKNVLTFDLQQEFAETLTGKTLSKLRTELAEPVFKQVVDFADDHVLIQVGATHKTMGSRYVAKSVQRRLLDTQDLRTKPLSTISAADRQKALNYKARQFRTQQRRSALEIQVKRVRAIFDENIGPGGGWRCPDGTLYGGQITDRFGRGCGGGLTRRIGRALMRAGRRLDNAGAARDSRRMARRARAAVQGTSRRERINAGRVRVANRLDAAADALVGDFAPVRPPRPPERPGRRVVVPGEGRPGSQRQMDILPYEILPTGERGKRYSDMSDDELQAALSRNQPAKPPVAEPGQPERIGFKPDSPLEQKRKEANRRAIEQEMSRRVRGGERARRREGAQQRGPQRRPAPAGRNVPERAPGQPAPRPAERRAEGGDPFDFIEDPAKREVVREALGDYANEIADLVQRRRRGDRKRRGVDAGRDGQAGGPDEEDRPSLIRRIIEALARAFQRFQEARENRRENRRDRRERRDARRVMLADRLDEAAQRILGEDAPSMRRRRGRDDSNERRRINTRAREVADRIGEDGEIPDPEMYRQYREERGIPDDLTRLNDKELAGILDILDGEERQFRQNPDTFDPVLFERRRIRRELRAEVRRRRAGEREQPRPPRRPRREATAQPSAPSAPEQLPPVRTSELDGSVPDDRSLRNVRNRFPQRGLPSRATWRNQNDRRYSTEREREHDRRFGRYYDADGKLNARGRYVNQKLDEERAAKGRNLKPNEVNGVVQQADAEFSEQNPIELADLKNIDPNTPDDTALLERVRSGDLRRDFSDAADRVNAQLDLGGEQENTPDQLRDIEDRLQPAINQQRLLISRLNAHRDGRYEMTDEERLQAVRDVIAIQEAVQPALGVDELQPDMTMVQLSNTRASLGILHPRFDGELRANYLRQRFGQRAAVVDGVNAKNFEGLRTAIGFAELGLQPLPNNIEPGNWRNWNEDEFADYLGWAAARSNNPQTFARLIQDKTGMNIDQAKRYATAGRQLESLAQSRGQAMDQVKAATTPRNFNEALARLRNIDFEIFLTNRDLHGIRAEAYNNFVRDLHGDFYRGLHEDLATRVPMNIPGAVRDREFNDPDMLDAIGEAENAYRSFGGIIAEQLNNPAGIINGAAMGPDLERQRYEVLKALQSNDRNRLINMLDARDGRGEFYNAPRIQVAAALAETFHGNPRMRQWLDDRVREYEGRLQLNRVVEENSRRADDAARGVDDLVDGKPVAQAMADLVAATKESRRQAVRSAIGRMYGDPNVVPWERWEQTEGPLPMKVDNLRAVASNWRNMTADEQRPIIKQLKKMYEIEHESNGFVYKSNVTGISGTSSGFTVTGTITVQLGNGQTKEVGSFNRELRPDGKVYSAYLAIKNYDLATGRKVELGRNLRRPPYYVYSDNDQEVPAGTVLSRNNGFATVFNQHAWGWANAAGFTKVGVGAGLEDGPYVWGRVGYRPSSTGEIQQMWMRADDQIGRFRQGRASIVENENQAKLLEYLSKQARDANFDPRRAPAQMEMILALEAHSPDRQRKGNVRVWVSANASIGSGQIYLADHDWNPADPVAPVAPLRNEILLAGVVQPAPIDVRIGRLSEPGLVAGDLVGPRAITNGQITTKAQAVRHLKNGGSLSEVPNELWYDAIKGNASTLETDPNTMFVQQNPDQAGAIGTTTIFRLRGPDGKESNQGVVFKSSSPRGVGAEQYDDVWAEVAGYNLAATIGLIPDGAIYAGFDSRGRQRVAIPYGRNLGAPGATLARGQNNYSRQLLDTAEEKGLPVRMTHMLHNFFLGTGDRHPGNGGAYVDGEGRAYIMPFDHGRVTRLAKNQTLENYARSGNFRMDPDLLSTLEAYTGRLNAQDRAAFRQKILANYDEMISRYRVVIAGGRDEFIRRMAAGSADDFRGQAARNVVAARKERLGAIYDHLKAKVQQASTTRDAIEQRL